MRKLETVHSEQCKTLFSACKRHYKGPFLQVTLLLRVKYNFPCLTLSFSPGVSQKVFQMWEKWQICGRFQTVWAYILKTFEAQEIQKCLHAIINISNGIISMPNILPSCISSSWTRFYEKKKLEPCIEKSIRPLH